MERTNGKLIERTGETDRELSSDELDLVVGGGLLMSAVLKVLDYVAANSSTGYCGVDGRYHLS